ncbi:cytochrome b5 domain-containing protein [Jeotgalibacillus haloalkalitolerans]|uniref:Cytochrome b5 domain-containing protein n=1 Tax=Jeotgalibacillus haloalkalitolerans TaxID=3104292 RepID=A0ABU5KNA4_9BACL|nr:cytochrome b5 domain-containing protein [Jeotgalibacillus sp. HH7-29]MDZ5712743.1 cytochrome b5 domain-containing protein [Jeotgalibacillus sp. HH7-29]
MHNTPELLGLQMRHLIVLAQRDLYNFSEARNPYMNAERTLQRLRETLFSIQAVGEQLTRQHAVSQLSNQTPASVFLGHPAIPPITPTPPLQFYQQNLRDLTVEELATFDGKNGRPAYVAVNGVVYDVTNNRAWAAATHFALTAGKDHSGAFASCHAGQESILTTLPVAGRLV